MQYKRPESEEPQELGVDAAHGDDREQAAIPDTLRLIEDFEPLEQPVQDQTVVQSDQDEIDKLYMDIPAEGSLSFITRGDANNINDPNPVEAERVIGVVKGTIPHLGYLFGFVQTRQGLILLVFIPGFLILLFEFKKIFGFLAESKVDKITADQKD